MAKAIIFDVDGVILDTEALAAQATIQAIKEFYDIELAPEDFHEFLGRDVRGYIEGALAKHGYKADDLEGLVERRLDIMEGLMKESLQVFPGVRECIEKLQDSDMKTAIATSSQYEKIIEGFKDVHIDIERFDVIVTGDDIANLKPAPDIYLETAKRLNLEPKQCLVIEDAITGVQAAKAAGMVCIAVTNSFPDEKLIEAGADMILPSLETLSLQDLSVL
jgi:HAD superfamily hydrolase (TIGR01509 family)